MAKWKLDFSGVEDTPEITPGRYLVKVKEIEKKEGSEYPYLQWTLVIVSGKGKGLHIRHITSLKPSALFNLRNTLVSLGLSVPKSAISLDPDKLIGRQMGVEVVMRPYEGKDYANVKKTFPASEFSAKPEVLEPTTMVLDEEEDLMILTDDDL